MTEAPDDPLDRIGAVRTRHLTKVAGLPPSPPHPLSRDAALQFRLPRRPPSGDPSAVHLGTCHCGGVRLEIDRALCASRRLYQMYCHCLDCRVAHSATVYSAFWMALLSPSDAPIAVVQGEQLLTYYHRETSDNATVRAFCSTCGTRLFNVGHLGVASFPSVFPSFPFAPVCHLRYRHSRLTVEEERSHAELPRLLDWPAEWGGSGLVLAGPSDAEGAEAAAGEESRATNEKAQSSSP